MGNSHTVNLEVQISVKCGACGARPDIDIEATRMTIHPCATCLKEARRGARADAFELGKSYGRRGLTGHLPGESLLGDPREK